MKFLSIFFWLFVCSFPASLAQAKDGEKKQDVNFILDILSEQEKSIDYLHVAYVYKQKPCKERDDFSRQCNLMNRLRGVTDGSGMWDEHYFEKFPEWESYYQCVLDVSAEKFKASVTNLKIPKQGVVQHLFNGKSSWVVDERSKVATSLENAELSDCLRIDNFIDRFPDSAGVMQANSKGKVRLGDLLNRKSEDVSIIPLGSGISRIRIVKQEKDAPVESYEIRDIDVDEKLNFSPVRYTISMAVMNQGKRQIQDPTLAISYSNHKKLPSGVYVPMNIHVEEFAALPSVITKESIKSLPWLEIRTYKLNEHFFEINEISERNPKDVKVFDLDLSNLEKGWQIFDNVSGKQYEVGNRLEELKEEVNKEKGGK